MLTLGLVLNILIFNNVGDNGSRLGIMVNLIWYVVFNYIPY